MLVNRHTVSDILSIMRELDAAGLLDAVVSLNNFANGRAWVRRVIPAFNFEKLVTDAHFIKDKASEIGLDTAAKSAETVADILTSHVQEFPDLPPNDELGPMVGWEPIQFMRLQHFIYEMVGRVMDGLQAKKVYTLSMGDASIYHEASDFGGDVAQTAFPGAIFDLEEGAKCYALGRYTASVFHLMRAMEVMVSVMAEKLEATIVDQHGKQLTWGKMNSNIGAKVASMPKGDRQDDWHAVHALLVSVNRGFRTPTAHPKAAYTQEEAEGVLQSVKSFIPYLGRLV